MSSVSQSNLHVADLLQREIPTCLLVQIDDLKFVAVLATGCSSSFITENAYHKIQKSSNKASIIVEEFNKSQIGGRGDVSENSKCVNLNAIIGGEPVLVKLTITPCLMNDIVLGCDFIKDVHGGFHFEINAFKWQCNDKINLTNFLSAEEYSSMKSVGASNEKLSTPGRSSECKAKDPANTCLINKGSSGTSGSYKITKIAKDRGDVRKTTNLEENSESEDGLLKDKEFDTKSSALNTSENCPYKNWKTVNVMTKEMHNMLGGKPLVFNGIFWSKGNKHNLVFQEKLDDKSPNGCHLFAIAKVLQIAEDHGWSRLRIYSNVEWIVNILNLYVFKHIIASNGAFYDLTTTEMRAYRFICAKLDAILPVRFEFVHAKDLKSSEMRLVERMIDCRLFFNL